MVLKPEKEEEAEAIFRKWGLDFAVVGETTPTKRFIVKHRGEVMADLPIKELGDEAPVYNRPFVETPKQPVIDAVDVKPPMRLADALEKLIGTPDLCSKRWVWEQYDHIIGGNTVQRPGGDAAVVRVLDGPKGLALTADVTPRYCEADPFEGGKQAVAEAWRNLTAVGAQAARAHRQSQFRQSGEAGDHGPVRRLRARHRAKPARRSISRSCPATCRSTTRRKGRGDPADADHRRRRPARRFRQIRDARLQGRRRGDPADRRRRPAGSASRSICATSAGGRRARRRRSISPPSAATAISCAA